MEPESQVHETEKNDGGPALPADCAALADQRVCREYRPLPGRARAFWTMAVVYVLGMAGGTLPSPLYPFYQRAFGFSNTIVTVIFALYGAGVIAALLTLGRLSDRAGRKPMLLVAAGLAMASTVSFLLADGIGLLMTGRFISGLAIGVLSGTATAALVELEPSANKRRASVVAGAVTPGGLALGTLFTGIAVQFGPLPLRLVFSLYLGLLALLAAAILTLPETVIHSTGRPLFVVQRLHVPPSLRRGFLVAATGVFATFAMMSTFAALVPSFLVQELQRSGPLLSGGSLALLFAAAASAPPLVGRLSIGRAGLAGLATIVVGLGLFVTGLAGDRLVPLMVGSAVAGFGGGCIFVGSLALINRDAPPDHRAEVVSAYFVAGYVGVTLPPIAVGAGSGSIGILPSVLGLCGVIVTLEALAAIGMQLGSRRSDDHREGTLGHVARTVGRRIGDGGLTDRKDRARGR